MQGLTNAERAKAYETKSKMLGFTQLSFYIRDMDTVDLVGVSDGTGRIVIPDFVTSIGETSNLCLFPFSGTHYSEIVLQREYESLGWAFSYMDSSKLKVVLPGKRLISLGHAFEGCRNLEYLDLTECDLRNTRFADSMIRGTPVLKTLEFGKGREFKRLLRALCMFDATGLSVLSIGNWFSEIDAAKFLLADKKIDRLELQDLTKAIEAGQYPMEILRNLLSGGPQSIDNLIIHGIPDSLLSMDPRVTKALSIGNLTLLRQEPQQKIEEFIGKLNLNIVYHILNGIE